MATCWVGRIALLAAVLVGAAGASERPTATSPIEPPLGESKPEREAISPFLACRQAPRRDEILIDTTRRKLHETVCSAAFWFDGLFGAADVDAARRSYGRVEVAYSYSEFFGNDTSVRFHARAHLPALERRLSVFVGLEDEDDYVRDRTEGQGLRSQARRLTDREEFLAGLGFAAISTETFQSDFKVGVRSPRLPKVFVQNRFSYIPVRDARQRVFLRTTPFWNNRDRFGVTGSADYDRVLGHSFLFRFGNIGTVIQRGSGLDWRSALVLYQNLRGSRAVAYETFIRGATAAPEPLAEYGVRTIFREPFLQERLFVELSVGYSWPRTDPAVERDGSYGAGVGVEMPFGYTPP